MNDFESDSYQVKLDNFEGPFDLLLYLVKNSKINLNDLVISEITHQFLNFLEDVAQINLESTSSFILSTSILLYIKSKTLIPQEFSIEEEEPNDRKMFIENLIEYQKYKNAASLMKKNIDEQKILIRKQPQLMIDFKDNDNWEEISIMDLIIAFSRIAKEVDKTVFKSLEMKEISMNEKINEILDYLIANQSLSFDSLFPARYSKYTLIITFLALLELVKMKKIYILQHKLFGNIKLLRRKEGDFDT